MFRASRAPSRIDVAWRLVAPFLVACLLLSAQALEPAPVAADATGSVATLRARLLDAESDMLRADRQIRKLQHLRRAHARLTKQARAKLKTAVVLKNKALRRALAERRRLEVQELRLARVTRVRPDPNGRQAVDAPKLRKAVRAQRTEVRQAETTLRKAQRSVDKARELKRSRRGKPTQQRLVKRIAERERSEARLSAAISAMTALAADRAGAIGAAEARTFRKPVKGHVSQPYGCTGFRRNPARDGCRHFHDGLDIAAPAGTAVHAAAAGYVAYVGYSPWDEGARAYVVIIEHGGGYQTVYAHLKPARTVVAGTRVERGDTVGRIGMTGTTTGPHVHWEVKRNGQTLNPLRAGP